MLEYFKIVLNGVSEDKYLFEKELRKASQWMARDELLQLKVWLKETYYQQHKSIIDKVFFPQVAQAS